jgi:hypothetical protein
MQGVVIHEFCRRSELYPVILLVVAEASNWLFCGRTLALCLAVGLGMECSRESVIYAHVGADCSPELPAALRVADYDYALRYTVFAEHGLENDPSHLR